MSRENNLPLSTPKAEVHIDVSLIQQLLTSQFAEFSKLDIQFMGAGWDNEMYRIGKEWIVRIPRRKLGVELIKNEQKWLSEISKRINSKIKIPIHHKMGQPEHGYPWTWSILPWLEGDMAIDNFPNGDQVEPLVQFFKQLHIPDPNQIAPENDHRGTPLTHTNEKIEEMIIEIKERGGHIHPKIKKLWNAALSVPFTNEIRWIHGDLHFRNILIHQGKINAIIDWGDLTSGDVATDLGCIWMLFDNKSTRELFCQSYGMDSDTILRAMGWATMFGIVFLWSGLRENPKDAQTAQLILNRLVDDY